LFASVVGRLKPDLGRIEHSGVEILVSKKLTMLFACFLVGAIAAPTSWVKASNLDSAASVANPQEQEKQEKQEKQKSEVDAKEVDEFAVPETDDVAVLRLFATASMTRKISSREEFDKRKVAVVQTLTKIVELTKESKGDDYFFATQQLLVSRMGSFNEKVFNEVVSYLKDKDNVDAMDLSIVQRLAMSAPEGKRKEVTQVMIATLADIKNRFSDEAVSQTVARMEGSVRFAELEGNEVVLTGTKVDGEAFDVKAFRGKVVLIDFWATWCGPCVAEHPNLQKNYAKYAAHGFEIVGISLDRDRDALDSYLEEHEVSWVNLHEDGGTSQAAEYYAVMSIPTMILVGRDGKVISTKARGKSLNQLLAKEFPDVKDAEESAEEASDK